ncbi:MAG: hypothetical protein E4H15_01275 [Syntrophobacterales bacterium]|nr:MAG: hypothetical protein E4H15_01275 [Syntrophobacterales bacterium]
MMSSCALACHECPTLLASQADDDEKRAEVAQTCTKQFYFNLNPKNIGGDGCHSQIAADCAYCDYYSCEKLNNLLKIIPHAQKGLDRIRSVYRLIFAVPRWPFVSLGL